MNAPYAGYPQPQQQPHPAPQQVTWQQPVQPRRARGQRWLPGLLAAFGFLAAAAAVLWGSFQKIQSLEERFGAAANFKYTMTWWRFDQTVGGRDTRPPYPPFGVLLAVVAGLLVLAAVLALAAFANRRTALVTGARLSGAFGTGLLVGVVGSRVLDALQVTQQVNDQTVREGDFASFSTGLGLWLPVGAAGLALLATIALLLRARPAAARLEPATPPMGVRLPYGTPNQQYQAQPQPGPQQQSGYQEQPGYPQPSTYQQPSAYQQPSGYQPAGTAPHGSPAPVPSPYEQPAPPLAQTPAPVETSAATPAETPTDTAAETGPAPAGPEPEHAPKGDDGDAARN
ncbi:MAG: hypothetical protein ACJ72N_13535 [Labedaea sp.]